MTEGPDGADDTPEADGRRIARLVWLVRHYDGAIAYFTSRLGFVVVFTDLYGNRWDLLQEG